MTDLSLGFRHAYLDHERLTAQLKAWEAEYPTLVRVSSIARTPKGRDVWLATIGLKPDRIRPAVWADGNIHAAGLAGSSAALATAKDALRVHLAPDSLDLPKPMADRLREILFCIVPRMSPDGAGGMPAARAHRAIGAAGCSRRARSAAVDSR